MYVSGKKKNIMDNKSCLSNQTNLKQKSKSSDSLEINRAEGKIQSLVILNAWRNIKKKNDELQNSIKDMTNHVSRQIVIVIPVVVYDII